MASSGNTTRSAPSSVAAAIASVTLDALPSRSPTTGSIWARATRRRVTATSVCGETAEPWGAGGRGDRRTRRARSGAGRGHTDRVEIDPLVTVGRTGPGEDVGAESAAVQVQRSADPGAAARALE